MSLKSVFILFFFLFMFSSPVQSLADEQTFIVNLKHGPLKVTIEYDTEYSSWADYAIEQVKFYLPRVEQYLGIRFPPYRHIHIYHCSDCLSWNQDDWIRINYKESIVGSPGLLIHELNHFWFRYDTAPKCQNWLIEGIVSYLPIAMREKGTLPDTTEYRDIINRYWGFNWVPTEDRKITALCPFDESKRSGVYLMSYRLQFLIHKILGPTKYQRFLRNYHRTHPHDNKAVIKLLRRFEKRNWRLFLRGWVFKGSYKYISFSDFTSDDDKDGLSNGEEYAYKTSRSNPDSDGDAIPDGAEILHELNPLKFNENASEIIRSYGPFIDGLGDEWELFDYSTVIEKSNDTDPSVSWADMSEMNYLIKDDRLIVRVQTAGALPSLSNVFFDILIDTNNDNHHEYEFGFYLASPLYPWRYDKAADTSESKLELQAGRGNVIEMGIPLSLIPTRSFSIYPIIRNNSNKINYDEWGSWVNVIPFD
ncbi:MAG: hypothetical protein GYA55_03485 [SAR324 cluster bacterium]|uniref:Peptidase M1 membrane alanine aminopeptidase domain-containing protein n=1 Tax=SAR324 cluster bacterium TaxID=2024889 RepID=A0A7X9FQW5_9DELT|nr:hypothetical protein [SAR324 cluster bacterium]